MGKGQNAVQISLSIFHGQAYGLGYPLRVVGAQLYFPHLPWWLKNCCLWIQCLAPRPKKRSSAPRRVRALGLVHNN